MAKYNHLSDRELAEHIAERLDQAVLDFEDLYEDYYGDPTKQRQGTKEIVIRDNQRIDDLEKLVIKGRGLAMGLGIAGGAMGYALGQVAEKLLGGSL